MAFKFNGWPRKTIGHLFFAMSSFVHYFKSIGEFKLDFSPETLKSGQNRRFFAPCDLQIWRMTLKSNRAPLLCYFKLCASFHSHWWIQTGVTVRKPPNWGKTCFDLCDLDLWPLTLTFCMDITFVNGNNFWEYRTGGRTDRRTEGQKCSAWSQLKIRIRGNP